MSVKPLLIVPILFFLLNGGSLGQKKFTVTLQFPKELDLTKLSLQYFDGKTTLNIKKPAAKNSKMTLSGVFYSKYAVVELRYPKRGHLTYGNSFFLTSTAAQINFLQPDSSGSPFDHYTIMNAYDFKIEKKQLRNNKFFETRDMENFIDSLGEKFSQRLDDSTEQHWDDINRRLFKKNMEYVSKTGNSYYSFWYFNKYLSYPNYIKADSVLRFFNDNFPDRFKNSVEGNTIKSLLHGMMMAKKGNPAPDFSCKDINGDTVSLAGYKGKKYVLLSFWATWCGPCIAEIPALRSIRDNFPIQNLAIISVSYQSSSYTGTADFIKKESMNWVNIYNDSDLINAWGGNKSVPRLYLIDKSGTIIYDKDVDDVGNLELTKLRQYLNELQLK